MFCLCINEKRSGILAFLKIRLAPKGWNCICRFYSTSTEGYDAYVYIRSLTYLRRKKTRLMPHFGRIASCLESHGINSSFPCKLHRIKNRKGLDGALTLIMSIIYASFCLIIRSKSHFGDLGSSLLLYSDDLKRSVILSLDIIVLKAFLDFRRRRLEKAQRCQDINDWIKVFHNNLKEIQQQTYFVLENHMNIQTLIIVVLIRS